MEFFGGLVCLFDGLRTGSSGVSPKADAGENTVLGAPTATPPVVGGGEALVEVSNNPCI